MIVIFIGVVVVIIIIDFHIANIRRIVSGRTIQPMIPRRIRVIHIQNIIVIIVDAAVARAACV